MRRIAFRWVLPILQIALAAGLLLLGDAQLRTVRAQAEERAAAKVPRIHTGPSAGKVVSGDLYSMWDGYTPPATQICVALNLPSFLISIPLALALASFFPEQPWVFYVAYGIGIVVFWTWVGFWVDRQRGLLRASPERPPTIKQRVLAWLGMVALACSALLLAAAFLWDGYSGHHHIRISLVAWLTIAAVFLGLRLWRWRALARRAGVPSGSRAS